MQILLLEASLMVFRCAKSRFRASFVVKSRDLVGFRVVVEFLECSRHQRLTVDIEICISYDYDFAYFGYS